MTPARGLFALIGSLVLAIGIYSVWPEYNPLAKFGVVVERTPFASSSLDSFDIYIKGQRPGPDGVSIVGDHLVIQYRDLDGDGVEEILIQSEDHKDSRTVLKVLLGDKTAVALHVLETHSMCIGFYKEGFHCP